VIDQTKAQLRPERKEQKANPNRYKLKKILKTALKKKTDKKKQEPTVVTEVASSSTQAPQYALQPAPQQASANNKAERLADLRRRFSDQKYYSGAQKTPEQIAEQKAQQNKKLAEQLKLKQEKEAKAKAKLDASVQKELAKQMKQVNRALGKK
jgi:hypothetical protein